MAAVKTINKSRWTNKFCTAWIRQLLFTLLLPGFVTASQAQWLINNTGKSATGQSIRIAHTQNEQGYSLEIFLGSDATVRARLKLAAGLLKLSHNSCPSYQIDNRVADNQSVDHTRCQSKDTSAEYILGKIANNQIQSNLLLAVMNGSAIIFRLQLENGDYRETTISLAGSKRSMTRAIGENISIHAQ